MNHETKRYALAADCAVVALILALLAAGCGRTCLPSWGFGEPYPGGTNVVADAEGHPVHLPPEEVP